MPVKVTVNWYGILQITACFDEQFDQCCRRKQMGILNTSEPRHEKTCFCHMRTTKAQISLRIRAVGLGINQFFQYNICIET